MIKSKKGQGLGGMLRVVVIGILFLGFYVFFSSAFDLAANAHTGAVKWLIQGIPFIILWIFLNFAFKLGEDTSGGAE